MTDFNRVIRYLAYALELLILFMLQETPGLLPPVFGGRPVLLLPAVLAIAMYEPELPAMSFGIAGGLFLDFGFSGALGFHALVLAVLCFFVSLLCRDYFQINLATALFTGVWTIGLVIGLSWFFLFYLKGYSMPAYAFTHHYLPEYLYTLLFLPLIYLLNRGLYQALKEQKS